MNAYVSQLESRFQINMSDKWIGKIAIVTGSSNGIGYAIFQDFLKLGLVTIGLDINPQRTEQLIAQSSDEPGKGHAYKCDITNLDEVTRIFDEIENKFNIIHIIVNNAGVGRFV